MIKSSVACGLQTCLGQQWTNEIYSDFTIVVEDTEFKCHRFILGSCSTFINGLLRSGMNESKEQKVVLQNMSQETFNVILNWIYKGEGGLTFDNVIQVWDATHFLDIAYLLKECEDFINENMTLSNFEGWHHHAKLLNSENVVKFTKHFMTRNFHQIWKKSTFLNLSFDDVIMIIDDHFLNVESEDTVIEAILKWIEHHEISNTSEKKMMNNVECYGSNINTSKRKCVEKNDIPQTTTIDDSVINLRVNPERSQQINIEAGPSYNNQSVGSMVAVSSLNREKKLTDLLKASRLCAASRQCLEQLMKHPKITSNPEALQLVHASLLYNWNAKSYSHHFIVRHRECSGFSNVMVFVSDGSIKVYSLQRECFYTLFNAPKPDLSNTKCIAAIDSKLFFDTMVDPFSYSSYSNYFKSFDTETDSWEKVAKANEPFEGILLSHNDTLTYINISEDHSDIVIEQAYPFLLIHDYLYVRFATIFNDSILIFSSTDNVKCVYRYNPVTHAEWNLPNITGTYTGMCSFQKDETNYILQKDGLLWIIEETSPDNIVFNRMGQLWNKELPLKGAVFYGDRLFVFYNERSSLHSSVEALIRSSVVKTIPTIGSINIQFVAVNSQTPVIPMTISTKRLR